MALAKSILQASLLSTFSALGNSKTASDAATEIADAIDIFVKSGTVTTTVTGVTSPAVPGLPSTVTGTGTGSVT